MGLRINRRHDGCHGVVSHQSAITSDCFACFGHLYYSSLFLSLSGLSRLNFGFVLLQPHSTQNNSDGFLAGRRRCPTINAVSELISVVSNGRLGFDDISVFDAVPFLDENVTEKDSQDIIDEAQDVFANMIKAKQPKVVISCFKTNTSNAILKCLRCRRIGYCFEFDPPGSKQLAHSGLSLIRVNAFHPSYAINRNPQFSCFKRLLVLEFTKAFALWQQNWVDEKWMSLLRHECSKQAKELSKGIFSASRYLKNYSDNFLS